MTRFFPLYRREARYDKHSRPDDQLNALFDQYRGNIQPLYSYNSPVQRNFADEDDDDIAAEGTVALCKTLGVDPEDVVLLSIAFELKSPRVGQWNRKGWLEGWRNLGCDTIDAMKKKLPSLRKKLGSDPLYFREVYNYTFSFARSEGQRSLALEVALAYWELLLPFGLAEGALNHVSSSEGEDVDMDEDEGWQSQHTEFWLEFMRQKGGKGVSKDTWQMLTEFIRSIDAKFAKHDASASWPSTIDDFVEWAKREKKLEWV
ncbi:defective in Cullin neddylation protein 1 [Phlebopus sp. FC_14]|nr:defective in Cullin neddylation protein 1 [Phlebopus sp. FC_14]